jgi:uncharacterized membrane protein
MSQDVKKYLTFSIVLNLLFVGFFLGSMSHRMVAPPPPPPHEIDQLLATLPESQRPQFESAMQPFWKEMGDLHIALEKEKAKAQALLKAEPFNADAYLAEARHITQMHAQQKVHLAESIATLAKGFTPEERAVLAEIVSRPPPGAYCPDMDKRAP